MALWLLSRADDDLTDLEHLTRTEPAHWWYRWCLSNLHAPPHWIDPLITMRQYTDIQAHELVSNALERAVQKHHRPQRSTT